MLFNILYYKNKKKIFDYICLQYILIISKVFLPNKVEIPINILF